MTTMPITSDRNNPIYQEKTKWSKEVLGEPCTDDRSEDCMVLGTYRIAENTVDFDVDDFRLVPISDGYEPLYPSKEVMHEIIRDLLKDRHGRNVNFV